MRNVALFLAIGTTLLVSPAHAQISDAERAAARQLFKEGDELQRAGKFADALDKFQRAQQVYSAPTNQLRIAECDAALGRLVESAEAYRAVVRTSLPAGSPPAFQSAIDQAKAELEQVEPRVPRVLIQVQPAGSSGTQLEVDGQAVSAALVGEPLPLDPGVHRVFVSATGFSGAEQTIALKERESRTISFTLRALPPAPPLQPPPPALPSSATSTAPPAPRAVAPTVFAPAPPPPPPPPPPLPHLSRTGFLVGGHIGAGFVGGPLPLDGGSVELSTISSGGIAFGADAGFRFARRALVMLVAEYDGYSAGDLSQGRFATAGTNVHSNAGLVGATIGFMGSPDHFSFYGDLGLAERWYSFSGDAGSATYNGGEFTMTAGFWIPAGHALRIVPKATLGIGPFSDPSDTSGTGTAYFHWFATLNAAALFNHDFY
jgi:hypothetical protein